MAAAERKRPARRRASPTANRRARPAASRTSPTASTEAFDDLADDLIDAGSREHYADAALYDYEYKRRRADVNFYRELAKKRLPGGNDILELGAGSGRVTIPLARDGHRVVALDQSPAMLAKLRERVAALPPAARDRVEVVRGELCTFELGRRFPLVIAAFNVLEHLYTRVEMTACLERVRDHLAPGGVFAFDVQMPDLGWLMRDPNKRWAKTRFTHPTTGRAVFYSTNHDYDAVNQIALIRIYYDPVEGGPGEVVKLTQRKFFPAELEGLIAGAGLRLVDRFGDFSGGPLDVSSDSQIVVCEAAPPRRKPGH